MSKKTFFAAVVALMAFSHMAKAQTNLQIFYDFGRDRKQVTTTLEGFYGGQVGVTHSSSLTTTTRQEKKMATKLQAVLISRSRVA